MNDDLLEFSTAYNRRFKDKFHKAADDYFSSLVEKGGVDVEANRRSAAEYRKWQEQSENFSKQARNKRRLRIFLIVVAVLAVVGTVICGVTADTQSRLFAVNIVVGVVLLAGFVAIIVVIAKVVTPKIKQADQNRADAEEHASQFFAQCNQQLAPLHALYDNFCTFELIQREVPLFKFDRNFNIGRYTYFREKYGLEYEADPDRSTVDVFSGEISGNPFYLQKEFAMKMGERTYQGSLTISWTETEYDSDGHPHTVTHTETLTASVTKPEPRYSYFTRLVYANDAAPDLSFHRSPTHAEKMSERELDRYVRSQQKKLRKKAAQSVHGGGGFTEMGNPEFDALFGATDRNNEVQFRLLFTPLAQKNLLNLIKTPDPYGDDFVFIKERRINYVASEHSQNWDYSVNTDNFVSYDVDICRKMFVDYNDGFFRSLYFEFAPLMSIPLYQQYKPTEYIYRHEFESNNTMFEAEVLANHLDVNLLRHAATKTDTILSAHLAKKDKDADVVEIDAYSFDKEELVELVPMMGGDGFLHDVPVHYINYVPLANQTLVSVSKIPDEQDNKKDEYHGASAIRHGLLVKILNDNN